MRDVLYNQLNLKDNTKFWIFLAEISQSTPQKLHIKSDQSSLNDKKQNITQISPIVDRFLSILLSLNDPKYYQKFVHSQNNFFKELGITYNLKSDERAVGYNLIQDPEYMLKYQFVSLAKYHNFYGAIDKYMKDFCKICLSTGNQQLINNLQNILNSEISILNIQNEESTLKNYKILPREIDPLVLAQPEFRFSAVGDKMKMIQNYLDLVKEKDRTKEAILLLERSVNDPKIFQQLTKSFDSLLLLIEDLDQDQSNFDIRISQKIGTFEKFKKTSQFIDEKIQQSFLNLYGIDGLNFKNIEDVYSPFISGNGSLLQTRSYLLKKGMTVQFADLLAAKYIQKLENTQNAKIHQIMNLFDAKRDGYQAINNLQNTDITNVYLNYSTLNTYSRLINNTEMINVMSSVFKNPQSQKFSLSKYPKAQPIRPISPIIKSNTVSSSIKSSKIFAGTSLRAFSEQQGGRGRFFDFLKVAEKIDEQQKDVEQQKDKQDQLANQQFQVDNIDISFKSNSKNRLESILDKQSMIELNNIQNNPIFETYEIKQLNEHQLLIQKAIKQFDSQFFMQFAFTGKDSLSLSQKSIEEYIIKMENHDEINLLLLSMINQSYELNHLIPNIELLIFKIFCSPQASVNDTIQKKQNYLDGNIFAQKQMKLHYDVYQSLLHTLSMKPKKKHFHKIVEYIRKYNDAQDIQPEIIDKIINIGIQMEIPITLGKLVKELIINDDCRISKNTFMKFLNFMEKSKGYEEDAKKFLTLVTQDSSSIQIDYQMCRPLILRMMKYQGGPEVIKFFEQLRKNIKLNKANSKLEQTQKNQLLRDLRKGFFTGLIKDLMENKSFSLAEIVMAEQLKEKFEVNVEDELIALKIYASQKKMVEFKQKFNLFFIDKNEGGYELTQKEAEDLSESLMQFQADEFKNERLIMAEKLNRKMQQQLIAFRGEVLHNIIFIYAESQLWNEVASVLKAQTNPNLCFPLPKTVNYLKQNLVFIFQSTQRQNVQEALEKFEQQYFSFKQRLEKQKVQNESNIGKLDDIKGDDIKELENKDKKMLRRQARQSSKDLNSDQNQNIQDQDKKNIQKEINQKQKL